MDHIFLPKKNILVVDDSSAALGFISGLIRNSGGQVFPCTSFEHAIEQFQKNLDASVALDLVLSDFFLGENKTALDLFGFILALKTQTLPDFMVMTSGEMGVRDQKLLEKYNSGFLQKPTLTDSSRFLKELEAHLLRAK